MLQILLCPSDGAEDVFEIGGGGGHEHEDDGDHEHSVDEGTPLFRIARSELRRRVRHASRSRMRPRTSDGMFFHNSQIKFANVKDGLSNTLVIGERSSKLRRLGLGRRDRAGPTSRWPASWASPITRPTIATATSTISRAITPAASTSWSATAA